MIESWQALTAAIASADPAFIGIVVTLLAAGCAFGAWRAYRNLHHARIIEDTPTCKARSAHQGYVELEGVGRLMEGPPIIAPLSGLPCCWYRFKIEEQITTYERGRARTQWNTLHAGVSGEVFWLEDDTGRVAIDPDHAEVTPRHRDLWHWRPGPQSYARLPKAAVARFAPKSSNPHRFTEERLNVGEPLYALGVIKNIGHHLNTNSIEDDVRTLLAQWKRDKTFMRNRFDLNRDGKIDEQEWRLARSQALREVRRAREEETRETNAEPINAMRATGDARRPYLLSAFPQFQLAQRYRRHALLYVVLFFTAGAVALWLFNTRFG